MRELPKVSIIIPTYNRDNYLNQAIESALSQDYKNLEVILSDNASTDNTCEIIQKYLKNKKFKYFRNPKNIGMYPNWHKAVYEYSSGEWFLILSSDDYLTDKSYISTAMDLVREGEDVVFVHASYLTENQDNKFIKNIKKFPRIIEGSWYFENHYKNGVGCGLVTSIFKRDSFYDFKFFSCKNILSCDRADFLRLALHGRVGFIDSIVAVYRKHSDSATVLADIDMYYANLGVVELAYEYAKNKQVFSIDYLNKWRRSQIKIFLNIVLLKMFDQSDCFSLKKLITRVKKEYPFAWPIFFYPRNFIKIILLKLPRLVNFIRLIKRIITNKNQE